MKIKENKKFIYYYKNQELNSETNDMFKGRCLLKYKCNQLDDLNEEIKKIYSEVNLVTSSII